MTTLRRQLVLLTFLMSVACAANPAAPDSTSSMPAWLTTLIRQSEEQPVANPPAFIARYDYKGQTVYFLPSAAATSWASSIVQTARSRVIRMAA